MRYKVNGGDSIRCDASGKILRDTAAVPLGSEIAVRRARLKLGITLRDKKVRGHGVPRPTEDLRNFPGGFA